MTEFHGQEVPYAISELAEDLPQADDMLAVVCTGTGIGLVAFMTGYYLQKQDLNFRDVGEVSSLSMLSDPIVNEETSYFESPGVKLKFSEAGKTPLLLAFGPRQPAAWEAYFVANSLFDAIERISKKPIMLSVGGFGVTNKEDMPEIVGRPNGKTADEFMTSQEIARMDDVQNVEGIAKILNAGQGFQAALPMLAMKRKIPSVFFLGTALMPDHMGVRLDGQAIEHVVTSVSRIAGLDLNLEKIGDEIGKITSEQKAEKRALYELAKRFSRGGQEGPNTDMYI